MMLPIGHFLLYSAIALWLLTSVGNWLCRQLLSLTGMKDAVAPLAGDGIAAGRVIGGLERLVIAIGVIAHSWEVLAAVIALKTVARFKELDKQLSAEYFLIGSLFSLLWAIVVTGAWLGYDHQAGIDLRRKAILAMAPEPNNGTAAHITK